VPRYELSGKVALVTGGARGIGFATCQALIARGASVVLVDLEQSAAERAAAQLHDTRAFGIGADVTDRGALQRAVASAVERFGGLDVVVANAGIATYAPALELTEQEWDEMVDINLSGVWRTIRASVPHIKERGEGGSVIITSSASGLRAIPNAGHYAAAKHGLVGFMKVLALELGRDRIRVNTIHPTTVDTPMVQNQATLDLFLPGQADQSQEAFARIARHLNPIPVPWIQPSTVSDLVAFLASDEAEFITGAAIPVDAGMAVRW
jgi:(+)-trans-carveol dehydrogenase